MLNEYGLDVPYFKGKLEQILRSIDRYTPGEMMRSLSSLVEVAEVQADAADQKNVKWVDLPNGTGSHGRCPDGVNGKRTAVRYRDGKVRIFDGALDGPDWRHDGVAADIVAYSVLGEPR